MLERITESRTDVGTSDFFHEIQEKLVQKTFPVCHVICQGILEQNMKSRTDVGTSEFFHEIQEKLVQKTFAVCHVTVGEYSSKIRKAARTLEQVIFSLKSKKNLFPKLFLLVT